MLLVTCGRWERNKGGLLRQSLNALHKADQNTISHES